MEQNYQPVQPQQQPVYQQPAYQQPAQQQYYPQVDTQPMSVGQYIGTIIVLGLPLIGFIMMLVWAFGSNVNLNRKNFCRAYLILGIIGLVLGIIFTILFSAVFMTLLQDIIDQMGTSY